MTSSDATTLMDAYRLADFVVHAPAGAFTMHVNARSDALLACHAEFGVARSCYITAWNPQSQTMSRDENDARQHELAHLVRAAGYPVLTGIGHDPKGEWPGEESLLVLGLPLADARSLGGQFGQLAVVWAGDDGVPQLVRPKVRGLRETARFAAPNWTPKGDTEVRTGSAPDSNEDLCMHCAESAFVEWTGWCADAHSTPVPLIGSVGSRGCPSCRGSARLPRDHVYYANYHSPHSTGLPDYFYLTIRAGGPDAYYTKWGEPYRSPRAGRCVPGERAPRFKRIDTDVVREIQRAFETYRTTSDVNTRGHPA